MSGGGGSSGGGTNTVQQVQQIPQFEQDFAQNNQNLARSIGSQNFPQYQGALVAGQTPLQNAGQAMAGAAAGAYQPDLSGAEQWTNTAMSINPLNVNPAAQGMGAWQGAQAEQARGYQQLGLDPSNAATVKQYMSPYVEAALAPQMQDLQLQLGQQQRAIDSQATQAGAFGDARQGAQAALQNLYGNQAMNQLVGSGYNTAYGNAMNAIQNQQGMGLTALNQADAAIRGQQGVTANEQGIQQAQQQLILGGGQQLANLAGLNQSLGITGANALYNAGQQQQGLQQQQLNTAYQQFQNQVNWPQQMLNLQESALSNSPYNRTDSVTLPSANSTASNLGAFANVAGSLGSLFGGGGAAPFGGTSFH